MCLCLRVLFRRLLKWFQRLSVIYGRGSCCRVSERCNAQTLGGLGVTFGDVACGLCLRSAFKPT